MTGRTWEVKRLMELTDGSPAWSVSREIDGGPFRIIVERPWSPMGYYWVARDANGERGESDDLYEALWVYYTLAMERNAGFDGFAAKMVERVLPSLLGEMLAITCDIAEEVSA